MRIHSQQALGGCLTLFTRSRRRLSQMYALVRSDLDTLLMPLLRQLYDATRRAPSHMYMLLVIVLILSQDAAFAAAVHQVRASVRCMPISTTPPCEGASADSSAAIGHRCADEHAGLEAASVGCDTYELQ